MFIIVSWVTIFRTFKVQHLQGKKNILLSSIFTFLLCILGLTLSIFISSETSLCFKGHDSHHFLANINCPANPFSFWIGKKSFKNVLHGYLFQMIFSFKKYKIFLQKYIYYQYQITYTFIVLPNLLHNNHSFFHEHTRTATFPHFLRLVRGSDSHFLQA